MSQNVPSLQLVLARFMRPIRWRAWILVHCASTSVLIKLKVLWSVSPFDRIANHGCYLLGSNLQNKGTPTVFTSPIYLSYIHLGSSVCLSSCHIPSCRPVIIAERWAILHVLVIKLTKETRRRVWRGKDWDGEIEKGQIAEGGCEKTFLGLSIT
jgi:hypothetical protein